MSASHTHRFGQMLPRLAVIATVAAALGSDVQAQGITPGDLPIEVTLKPRSVLPGTKVTISGTLPGYSGGGNVSVGVTPPQAASVTLVAKSDAQGKYTTAFTETSRVGMYSVRAVAPDGKGVVVDSFMVVTMTQAAGAQQQTITRTFDLVVKTINTARKVALETPPSPPQQILLQKLAELEKQMADAPKVVEEYRSSMQTIVDVVKTYPETAPVVQPLLDEITPMAEELEERLVQIEKLVDGSEKLAQFCDDMVVIEETLIALTWAMGVTDKIGKTVLNWAIAKVPPWLVKTASSGTLSPEGEAALSTAAKTTIKALKGGKSWNWTQSALSALKDVMQYATGAVFNVYCERFQGPMTAKLVVTFNHNGRPYLKYDIHLTGKLVANFAKEAGVTRIPIKGYIEGNATHFGLAENFDVLSDMVEVKTGMGRMSVMRFMPPPAPYVDALGMVGRMVLPAYFNIPVTGELVRDKLTLRIEPAAIDFTPAVNKGKLVMIWILKLPPFVYVRTATLPLQNAHFILARGIVEPAPQFPITIDMGGKRSLIGRRFTRDHNDPAKGIRVQFDVNIKACNPSCM